MTCPRTQRSPEANQAPENVARSSPIGRPELVLVVRGGRPTMLPPPPARMTSEVRVIVAREAEADADE